MNRSSLLRLSSILGIRAVIPAAADAEPNVKTHSHAGSLPIVHPLQPPAAGAIPVAFLLSDAAVVIDFTGPWEVFQDVVVPGRTDSSPFELYTVAETTAPIRTSGGMTIVPNYSFATAPAPKLLVIPAQSDPSAATIAWIRHVAETTDVTMSVCAGAFVLAKTGLLSGKAVTTHHFSYVELALDYPQIHVERGVRFVDSGNIATAGGLSCGIDLALHVVERYFGHAIAANTADRMEYQGRGWLNPGANRAYAKRMVSTGRHHRCAVCEMDVDPEGSAGINVPRTHVFGSKPYEALFAAHPDRFANV